jgi:hypothetical protein
MPENTHKGEGGGIPRRPLPHGLWGMRAWRTGGEDESSLYDSRDRGARIRGVRGSRG